MIADRNNYADNHDHDCNKIQNIIAACFSIYIEPQDKPPTERLPHNLHRLFVEHHHVYHFCACDDVGNYIDVEGWKFNSHHA